MTNTDKIYTRSYLSDSLSLEKKDLSGVPANYKIDDVVSYLRGSILGKSFNDFSDINGASQTSLMFYQYKDFFESFLHAYLKNNNLQEKDIEAVAYADGKILLDFAGKGTKEIPFTDFLKELAFGRANIDDQKVKQKIEVIHLAMNAIYADNKGMWDSLDDTDIIDPESVVKKRNMIDGHERLASVSDSELTALLQPYGGMHLGELYSLLNAEQKRLMLYYDIVGRAGDSIDMLDRQIEYGYAVGDRYDRGERLTLSERRKKHSIGDGIDSEDAAAPKGKEVDASTRTSLIHLASAWLDWGQDALFAKEEKIVNVGEIVNLRDTIQNELKRGENDPDYRYLRFYKKCKKFYDAYFASFEGKSNAELRHLLSPLRGFSKEKLQRELAHSSAKIYEYSEQNILPIEKTDSVLPEMTAQVESMVERLSSEELIEYISSKNRKIHDNWHVPDMSLDLNRSLIKQLSEATFKKLKREDASVHTFANFIRVITGRSPRDTDGTEKDIKYWLQHAKGDTRHERMEYATLKVTKADEGLKQIDLARRACLYVLINKKGIEQMGKEVKIEDDIYTDIETKVFGRAGKREVSRKKIDSVNTIVERSLHAFEEAGINPAPLAKAMHFDAMRKKGSIDALSFEEKLLLGTIYRISKDLKKNLTSLKGKNPKEIQEELTEKNNAALKETFKALNAGLEKNFEGGLWGKEASEMGLSKENAEIYDLYGEINGRGIRLADDNWIEQNLLTNETTAVIAVGIFTAWLVLPGVVAAQGGWALVTAGAKLGLTTSIASQIMSKQGYDTFEEMLVGRLSQLGIDVAFSAAFTFGSAALIGKIGGKAFASKLSNELKSGQITGKTEKSLREIQRTLGKEIARDFGVIGKIGRTPQKLWKPEARSVYREFRKLHNAGYDLSKGGTGVFTEDTINYLARYRITTGFKGNLIDMGIGLADGAGAGILYYSLDIAVIDNIFSENHFTPQDNQTFYTEKDRARIQEIKNDIQEKNNSDPQAKEAYEKLSDSQKSALPNKILLMEKVDEIRNRSLEELSQKESEALSQQLGESFGESVSAFGVNN